MYHLEQQTRPLCGVAVCDVSFYIQIAHIYTARHLSHHDLAADHLNLGPADLVTSFRMASLFQFLRALACNQRPMREPLHSTQGILETAEASCQHP